MALARAKVRLEDVTSSRTAAHESVLATALTKHDGLWFALLKPKSNLLLRALHAEAPATASALIAVGVAPALSLSLTREGGNEFTAVGTVTPDKRHVVLEAARGRRQASRAGEDHGRGGRWAVQGPAAPQTRALLGHGADAGGHCKPGGRVAAGGRTCVRSAEDRPDPGRFMATRASLTSKCPVF